MLNSNQWLHQHNEFIDQALALLNQAQECVAHLQMIEGDEDAIAGLQTALLSLTDKAAGVSLGNIAEFTGQLQHQLKQRIEGNGLNAETINTLKHCFDLLAWQLELIDPHTGELLLDEEEQHALLGQLAL